MRRVGAIVSSLGHPSGSGILRECWAAVRARPVSSVTTALVIGLVCLVTLATTGRAAAIEQRVLDSVDSIGTALITVTDSNGSAGIHPSVVEVIGDLDGVDWAFALGPADDALPPDLTASLDGEPLTARSLLGELPGEVLLTAGRSARTGEAVAGRGAARSLGLVDAVGGVSVRGQPVAVVGTFTATGPLDALDSTVLIRDDDSAPPIVRYVYVRAEVGYDVAALAEVIQAILPAEAPSAVTVELAQGAIDLREVLAGSLGESSRQLMLMVLGIGLLLVAITMTGAVNARRRDFGRQRAIGATRSAIVAMVLIQSLMSGAIGAVVGSAAGVAVMWGIAGAAPSLTFTLSVVLLSLLVTIVGAAPPAIAASRRDPVSILRVP